MRRQASFFKSSLWDLFCTASIAGIWPRFIEPKLIFTTRRTIQIPKLPSALYGFKILQISDLHLNTQVSDHFLNKIISKCNALKPDLIVLTGDFLCHGQLNDPRLKSFLSRFKAPYGCYGVLGNHDYAGYVAINSKGEYDLQPTPSSYIEKGFKRLTKTISLTGTITPNAKNVGINTPLLELLRDTPFTLLHNKTLTISVKDTKLNISGLGEHMAGRLDAAETFKNYQQHYPGLVLLHNPDGLPSLKNYPGDIILCGHTHGGQINLPWLWKKFTVIENLKYKSGLFRVDNKWLYVNRGIGSVMQFRWFSPPEILLLTLE